MKTTPKETDFFRPWTAKEPEGKKKPRKKKNDYSRDYLPVGTIRIRQRNGGQKVRMIKVRNDGPKSGRWINWARYWWELNKGPVPPGKRVGHLDGDTLNDDPKNLALMDPGDVLYLAHERDPEMSRENSRVKGLAFSEMNQNNARFRRLTEVLPTRWYPLDPKRGIVFNRPCRMSWQVYRIFGVKPKGPTPPEWEAAVLGWPELPMLAAQILATLALGPCSYAELLTHVNAHRDLIGRAGASLPVVYSMVTLLRSKGLIWTRRNGSQPGLLGATDKALAERKTPCKIVAIRGGEGFGSLEQRGWIRGNG